MKCYRISRRFTAVPAISLPKDKVYCAKYVMLLNAYYYSKLPLREERNRNAD